MKVRIWPAGLISVVGLMASHAFASASLNTCQKTVVSANAKYVQAVASAAGSCLGKMSTQILKKDATVGDAATAAATACVTAFGKLLNSANPAATLGGRFDAKVGAKCDPAVNPNLQHVDFDTVAVGPTTLGAGNLSAYCATLGGDGSIDSFAEWRTCLHAAADSEAREAILLRWPRALEYFDALRPAIAALPTNAKRTDALAALTALDAAIEGPVDDNLPDPPAAQTGLLATGEVGGLLPGCTGGLACDNGHSDGHTRAGFTFQYRDNGEGTISDLVTGLIWEKLGADASIHAQSNAYTFVEALTGKIAGLNAGAGFAGHTDWRLPNRRELQSLVDFESGNSGLVVNDIFNTDCQPGCSVSACSCTLAEPYWSSTSYQADASQQWVVEFHDGLIQANSATTAHVRAVRGGTNVPAPPVGEASAGSGPSLNDCQKAVAKQSAKYIGAVTNTVGKCLGAMSAATIKKEHPVADAALTAAKLCLAAFRKLLNTATPQQQLGTAFTTKVAAKCDPAVNPRLAHLDADTYTIGTHTIGAGTLGAYCFQFGGAGTIGSFAEWSTCVRQAADAEAREAITLRWPRALEYFAALEAELTGLPASAKLSDALAALTALAKDIDGPIVDGIPDAPFGPAATLLATGQTQCAQDDLSMGPCPGGLPGQDGQIRAGRAHSYTDNGDGTISDNVTGLMWEKQSDDDSVHDRDHNYIGLDGASYNKVGRLNRHQFAGHGDWRVPNARELESLVDASRTTPAIDPIFEHDCTPGCSVLECSCTAYTWYVSSTTSSSAFVNFNDGSSLSGGDGENLRVRAVRGGHPHAYAGQAPTALDIDVKHPWMYDCVPISLLGRDVDSPAIFYTIDTFPQNGFLTEFTAADIPAGQPDHPVYWGPTDDDASASLMYGILPLPEGNAWSKTLCYVSFSPTFTGTDSFTYHVVDGDGNVSNGASATITIYEM